MKWMRCWIAVSLLGLVAASAPAQVQAEAGRHPPRVSARAWAIMDGAGGQLLWGHEQHTPAKAASTTKIMCAYVILKLAENDPAVLDELVTISKFADDTSGSTADVREGEIIPAGDLLYGLMLPSGNDAGNALAEHFNDRFAPPAPGEFKTPDGTDIELPTTARSNFVAEMNRTARKLALDHTIYRIPYGDGGSAEDRTTTAADLLRLAHAAMQLQRFRTIVASEKHAATVKQPDGSTREAQWTNTNQLLSQKGFDGVKTGTTRTAGACLVSSNRRGDEHLLAVVLGSASSDARYDDTEVLLRWAWAQRGHVDPRDPPPGQPLLTVRRGTLPIILTAPHGGHLPVPGAPRRAGAEHIERFITSADMRTAELAELIADSLERELGGRPYLVIARFHRRFADANRSPEHAYEDELTRVHYDAFHHAIREASADIRQRFGHGLLLDIHGQGTSRDAIYRGTRQGNAVRDLLAREGLDAVIGPMSLFGRFAALGYETFPQPADDGIGHEQRYSGGFITEAHGSHNDTRIDAIQLEFGTNLRLPDRLEQTAADTARSIAAFARAYLPRPATD